MRRDEIEEDVLSRITPTPEEAAHLKTMADRILAYLMEKHARPAMVVGSVARGTFVRGDRDLDIFMLFPPDLSRDELARKGIAVARDLVEHFGGSAVEKYAEHPYLNARIHDLDLDLVPCYHVASAREIISAVDRTPFHTRYIIPRIPPFIRDALLMKQFAKAGGVYGSDHMTEGFSGYLCELLVLSYGGFSPLIEAAAGWRPGTLIDPEHHRARSFEEPLVVVDPTDPNRNVAAALSLDQMSAFIELARIYRKHPSPLFFEIRPPVRFSKKQVADAIAERGTAVYGISLSTPAYVPDTVVPQLRKSTAAIALVLERAGFSVNRTDCFMGEETSLLLFELNNDTAPPVLRHTGPPVSSGVNAERFVRKYLGCPSFSGPFIEDGRYIVEIQRSFTDAFALLSSEAVLGAALGKHVKKSMKQGWSVQSGSECWREELSAFFAAFFERSSPAVRILRLGGE
ncbi:MAG: CCA tRNA nucleotidyltransferase [Methanocalculus sp. MSAO_Arc1]|uniref:CCA tRNA nucleotidyltransferase n=1 Tax=Methanocalculus TaxID=71151 RepID=UPI000FF4BEC9|nr:MULTISPECIES: CCA tRNA nucleotidyltransferase [unclassified Methanocalculus]MCP1662369.1 tRNA nucleotidyltransferase (CCA-adding enzyme) [Methanocalculus sp. AMF5]RQD81384.1 MAG: CCA tRNA nucleotidyltransferase [Methanocalculus sp. MSAO_Arc1]